MVITQTFNVTLDTSYVGRKSAINVDAVSVIAAAHDLTIFGACDVALALRDSVAVVAVPAETLRMRCTETSNNELVHETNI